MKSGSSVAANEVHLSHWERSDRITDAIRVRGYGLSMELRPLTRSLIAMLGIAISDRPLPDGERWTAIVDGPIELRLIMF